MKCFSLWQPWASAVAMGAKKVETRHRPTPYRGTLAIHAAKRYSREQHELANELRAEWEVPLPDPLPLGCVVALAELVDVEVMTPDMIDAQTRLEYRLGGWVEGRFAYRLEDVRALDEPLPLTGRQWIWTPRPSQAAKIHCRARRMQ